MLIEKPNYTYKFEFDRAYDGDTAFGYIDLGFKMKMYRSIRFLGIDTEEMRDKDPERKLRAYAARDRVIELCENAKQVYVRTERDKSGKYGRLLGWLIVEDADGVMTNVNELLVEEGFEKAPK